MYEVAATTTSPPMTVTCTVVSTTTMPVTIPSNCKRLASGQNDVVLPTPLILVDRPRSAAATT